MEALWQGVLSGLILAITFGPVFFSLMQTSIEEGVGSGIFMALGISLSDTLYVFVCYLGLSQITKNDDVGFALGIIGGIIMIFFGLFSIIRQKRKKKDAKEQKVYLRINFLQKILKGFMLNGINPSVLIIWVGFTGFATLNYENDQMSTLIFFSAIIGTVFVTDCAKVYLATKLRRLITTKFIVIMNRIVGIALILFSLKLFHHAATIKGWL